MPTARLPDGREVDTGSPEWRAHTLAVWTAEQRIVDRHVEALKRAGGRQDRADYLERVKRVDGPEIAERVVFGFGEWFEAQKKRREGMKP